VAKDGSAPGSLELVRSFVNSIDVERPETLDALADIAGARVWLADAGVDPAGLSADALRDLRELREAFRSALLAHTGECDEDSTWRTLAGHLGPVRLEMTLAQAGHAELGPANRAGVEGLRGALAAALYDALRDGTWSRLKVCRDHGCLFAFYDRTKNGSGAWCSMETCGNRAKAQRRRARERPAPS